MVRGFCQRSCKGFCLSCVSIHRRRRSFVRQQMRDRECVVETRSFLSGSSPSMHGPILFVWRYFLGTHSPAATVCCSLSRHRQICHTLNCITKHRLPSSPHTHADTSRFTSPCYAWRGAVGPTTSVPCGFIPSLPVIAYVIPWITQQTTPPGCTEIAESTSLEVAPILPTPAIFPSSRPTRSLRRSKSSSLPDSNYYLNRRHRNLAIMNRNIDS